MYTVSVAIQKGGSGKTTTALHLAAGLAKAGARVLAVDLDPQMNLSQGLGFAEYIEAKDSVYTCLIDETPARDVIRTAHALDLLPGSEALAAAEMQLVSIMARETALRRVLKPLQTDYDFCIIDCPPSLGLLTVNGLAASQGVIMPLTPEYFPVRGAGLFVSNLERIKAAVNSHLELIGVLLTRYDSHKIHHREAANLLRENFPGLVYDTYIRQNIALAEAAGNGLPVYDYDPGSNGAKDYREFVREFANRLNR